MIIHFFDVEYNTIAATENYNIVNKVSQRKEGAVLFGKSIEKSTCAAIIKIIITFANQIFV